MYMLIIIISADSSTTKYFSGGTSLLYTTSLSAIHDWRSFLEFSHGLLLKQSWWKSAPQCIVKMAKWTKNGAKRGRSVQGTSDTIFNSADKPTFKEDIPLLSTSSLHLQLKTTAVELDNPLDIARATARIRPSSPRAAKGVVQLTKWERVIKHPSGTLQCDYSMSSLLESWCCSLFNDTSKGSEQRINDTSADFKLVCIFQAKFDIHTMTAARQTALSGHSKRLKASKCYCCNRPKKPIQAIKP